MINFDLWLFNFPVERLFDPRQRLKPIKLPEFLIKCLYFPEEKLNNLCDTSNVYVFVDYFTFDLGFDNLEELKEYILTHDFFLFSKKIGQELEKKQFQFCVIYLLQKEFYRGL